jgi:hypothetical protein
MRNLRIVYSLLVLLAATSIAVAQSEDWQTLKGIPAGTKIKVILKHKRMFGHCQLEDVTDKWLGCYFSALGYRQYARDDVQEVRLGHHSAMTGLAIGAGTGAILGATESGDGATRLFRVMVATPVLGYIGAGVGTVVDPFLHGKTIYRSPAHP